MSNHVPVSSSSFPTDQNPQMTTHTSQIRHHAPPVSNHTINKVPPQMALHAINNNKSHNFTGHTSTTLLTTHTPPQQIVTIHTPPKITKNNNDPQPPTDDTAQPIATTQTFNHLSSQLLFTHSLKYHHVTAAALFLSSSVTHDFQATTSNHLPFASLSHALLSLLLMTFRDATSLLILHDGTAAAREVLTHFLQEKDGHQGHFPEERDVLLVTQIRDLSLLMPRNDEVDDDSNSEGHDTHHFDLTLVIFLDHHLVSRFLVAKSLGWVSRPLLFFSVSDDAASREVLDVSLWIRRVTLLQPQEVRWGVKGEGELKFQMSTLLPHTPAPHNLISRLVTPGDPSLKEHHLFPDPHSDFHGHVFYIASWIDDFPYLFYDSASVNQPTKPPTNPPITPSTNPITHQQINPSIIPSTTNQPTTPSTNQPTNHPINKPTQSPINKPTHQSPHHQPTNQPTLQSTNPITHQPTNPPSNQPTNPSTNQPTIQSPYQQTTNYIINHTTNPITTPIKLPTTTTTTTNVLSPPPSFLPSFPDRKSSGRYRGGDAS
ncbi:hypothetical protein Pcinc_017685 [Petrolisthes cinctipes]|uniref:Uncharacterized protein n=1 Tax=Petrolisthes cinctipes TaxID=88211 RepID=A0AAE1FQX0_PETCI|nr:hypothetical protein Pcinc_017685 [Petrolisthes cinctipes]